MQTMRDNLTTYFNQNSSLSNVEIVKLVGLFRSKLISKGDFWIRQNEPCDDIAYLESGILRVFHTHEDEEITLEFILPDSFTTALRCSAEHHLSSLNYQAINDCELLLIDKDLHRNIITGNTNSFEFYEKELNNIHHKKEKRLMSLLHLNAEERFFNLFKEQPEIFNLVPLKHIASSLGITPETLSRLRKKLVKRSS